MLNKNFVQKLQKCVSVLSDTNNGVLVAKNPALIFIYFLDKIEGYSKAKFYRL